MKPEVIVSVVYGVLVLGMAMLPGAPAAPLLVAAGFLFGIAFCEGLRR